MLWRKPTYCDELVVVRSEVFAGGQVFVVRHAYGPPGVNSVHPLLEKAPFSYMKASFVGASTHPELVGQILSQACCTRSGAAAYQPDWLPSVTPGTLDEPREVAVANADPFSVAKHGSSLRVGMHDDIEEPFALGRNTSSVLREQSVRPCQRCASPCCTTATSGALETALGCQPSLEFSSNLTP